MNITKRYIPPIALLLVSTIGVAYAVTTLFTQTFPAISATAPAIKGNCATLTPNVSSVIAGTSGFIEFDCSGTAPFGTTAAYTVNTAGTFTPTFTLPTGYTGLAVVGPKTCSSSPQTPITSGLPFTSVAGIADYCAQYSNAPSTGLGTFSVTWSQ